VHPQVLVLRDEIAVRAVAAVGVVVGDEAAQQIEAVGLGERLAGGEPGPGEGQLRNVAVVMTQFRNPAKIVGVRS